jgi:DNA-3-methyladenine glycosylase I
VTGEAGGERRCSWASGGDEQYRRYHDEEWGRPVTGDAALFERLVLEGFQAGLSWATILRKRDRFREVFHGFGLERVAGMGGGDVEHLLADPGIVRHRGKIDSAIGNARRALEIVGEFGSMAAYLWPFAPPPSGPPDGFVAVTPESTALSKDLKRRGWTFVGPTTMYAAMQAIGMVNDHEAGCATRPEVEALRLPVLARYGVGAPAR